MSRRRETTRDDTIDQWIAERDRILDRFELGESRLEDGPRLRLLNKWIMEARR